jgi:hypothetical protein
MSEQRVYIRVSKTDSGVNRELIVDGVKVADLTFFEAVALAMQVTSSLRWEKGA